MLHMDLQWPMTRAHYWTPLCGSTQAHAGRILLLGTQSPSPCHCATAIRAVSTAPLLSQRSIHHCLPFSPCFCFLSLALCSLTIFSPCYWLWQCICRDCQRHPHQDCVICMQLFITLKWALSFLCLPKWLWVMLRIPWAVFYDYSG